MRILSKVGLFATVLATLGGTGVQAETVSTIPEGYVTLNIAAGTGTTGALTVLSLPLRSSPVNTGRITSVAASTISNSEANWTANAYSQAATPYYIRITSGTAAGRTFLISTTTANTSTTLTISSTDAAATNLTSLGIATGTTTGDTYEIVACDTISSVFGSPATTGIQGGSTSATADQVRMYLPGSGWLSYYYNTTSGWLRVGPPIASGNLPIRPETGIYFMRFGATPINLTVTGRVPNTAFQTGVANSGVTVLCNNWPVDTTLANTNIRNLAGWVTGASSSTADIVRIYTSANGWRDFYHNGTNWLRVGPPINSNNEVVAAGAAVTIVKKGSASGQAILTQTVPYTL